MVVYSNNDLSVICSNLNASNIGVMIEFSVGDSTLLFRKKNTDIPYDPLLDEYLQHQNVYYDEGYSGFNGWVVQDTSHANIMGVIDTLGSWYLQKHARTLNSVVFH
ncbi:hypothetical protein BC455_22600 [Vibrio harveyi]|nr:hypothetical protein BC455_22600 [Vibrio harveyi]